MKNKIKSVIKSVVCLCLVLIATGCDLQVQEKFKFDPDTDPQVTFGSVTPYEWLSTLPRGDYNYMKQAIDLTGLQELYDGTGGEKTYFFLKDIAWTKAGGILKREFGGATTLTDAAKVDINKLRNLLRYHIISTYVDQGPDNLFVVDRHYIFYSLYYTGTEFDKMSLTRDRNYGISLNRAGELAISKKGAGCKLHNYIFSDGNSVAHILEDYAKNIDFNTTL